MELQQSEFDGIKRMAAVWLQIPEAEMEATLPGLDVTSWQDVIQYLRSLGMKEQQNAATLNISLPNNLRFTLEGSAIQRYCRDNSLRNKTFKTLIKEKIADADEVNLTAYGSKIKLRRETPLEMDDARVVEAMAKWDSYPKFFRNIQRFEFNAPGSLPIRFDLSIIRSNKGKKTARSFQEAEITSQAPTYECEIELTSRESVKQEDAVKFIIQGISTMLRGKQRSFIIMRTIHQDDIRTSFMSIFKQQRFQFPGPQPVTLEQSDLAKIKQYGGGYNVTDKADGLRCALYIHKDGSIYLIDGGGRIYGTGFSTSERDIVGSVLDGEWVRLLKDKTRISHFMAFDLLAGPGGNLEVRRKPFITLNLVPGSNEFNALRHTIMTNIVASLGSATTTKIIPQSHRLQFSVKEFKAFPPGNRVFIDGAKTILGEAERKKYNTDGLIFTANAAPLPDKGTWSLQLKWKPPHENTIDFLVLTEKERSATGAMLETDLITERMKGTEVIRCKTLRLYVGGRLSGRSRTAGTKKDGWGPVPFKPQPLDGQGEDGFAGICFAPIDTQSNIIATQSGDVVQENMIVEMSYDPDQPPGWRWSPMRVRFDKTERFISRKEGSTMNADSVAESIWKTLHNPVTEGAICSGEIKSSDSIKRFTNYIRDMILSDKVIRPSSIVCDLSMSDHIDENLVRWENKVSFAIGMDTRQEVIEAANNKLQMEAEKSGISFEEMSGRYPFLFIQADTARSLVTGQAGMDDASSELLKSAFNRESDIMKAGISVAYYISDLNSVMRDQATLGGFINNLASILKVGSLFVGCCLDGGSVAAQLAKAPSFGGGRNTWTIARRYDTAIQELPTDETCLGLEIEIKHHEQAGRVEFIVNWPFLQSRLATAGFELLTPAECKELSLPAGGSTALFKDSYSKDIGLDQAGQKLMFLNRWFVMKRKNEMSPSPVVTTIQGPSAPKSVTRPPPASSTMAPPEPTATPAPPAPPKESERPPATPAPPKGSERPPATSVPPSATPAPPKGSERPPATPAPPATSVPPPATIKQGEGPPATSVPPTFLINPEIKTPDLRLGEQFSDWQYYLSFRPLIELSDIEDPSVKYPSMIAAISAAMYQFGSEDPPGDSGRGKRTAHTLFSVGGDLHQSEEAKRAKLRSEGKLTQAEFIKSVDKQATQTNLLATLKSNRELYKINFIQSKWDAMKEQIYRHYLTQRFSLDAKFRGMLTAMRGGTILFGYGEKPSYIGVGVSKTGEVVGGENTVGKIMMELSR